MITVLAVLVTVILGSLLMCAWGFIAARYQDKTGKDGVPVFMVLCLVQAAISGVLLAVLLA